MGDVGLGDVGLMLDGFVAAGGGEAKAPLSSMA
jgi:hypothetical protein